METSRAGLNRPRRKTRRGITQLHRPAKSKLKRYCSMRRVYSRVPFRACGFSFFRIKNKEEPERWTKVTAVEGRFSARQLRAKSVLPRALKTEYRPRAACFEFGSKEVGYGKEKETVSLPHGGEHRARGGRKGARPHRRGAHGSGGVCLFADGAGRHNEIGGGAPQGTVRGKRTPFPQKEGRGGAPSGGVCQPVHAHIARPRRRFGGYGYRLGCGG